jgi:PPOX class probable F420-dependent enzyme
MTLPDNLLTLLQQPSRCFLATVMPDGSPQVTQTWVDTDGDHVLINVVQGSVKQRNIARDPRVAVAIADPNDAGRYVQARGHVIQSITAGAAEHIERLSQKYLGRPYPWYGGRDQTRIMLVIEAETISGRG